MHPHGLDAIWDLHLEGMRRHAHQLLVWAYHDARGRIRAAGDEPDITGLLGDAMRARLDHPETPDEYLFYAIGDQVPVSPNGELGNKRKRLDLMIGRTGIKPQLSYVFEAKRLMTSRFTIGDYVGPEGLGDFVACRYAQDCPEAAMIGLFHNKSARYWHDELRRALRSDDESPRPALGVQSHPTPVLVLNDLDDELESSHLRANRRPIRVFHIFLDCT